MNAGDIMFSIFGLFLILCLCSFVSFGLPLQTTSEGLQFGYVVSVDQRSLPNAYVIYYKSELESSESNAFCTANEDIATLAAVFAETNTRVKFRYDGIFASGIMNCSYWLNSITPISNEPKQ